MHFLKNINILTQIKEYFIKGPDSEIKDEDLDGKEMAKSKNQHSTLKTQFSNQYYQSKIQNIVKERLQILNPMMSVSYASKPLKLKNARGQYLYEECGTKVLDCINNVSHIGHCHPYYVMRMNSQNTKLLTNSRFLYDELLQATHKLLKKLPKQLCVVTFVNSGSQANDLAMQMAAIHSKKRGVMCYDGAYHGITAKCIQVSPYKWSEHYRKADNVQVLQTPCFYRGAFREQQNPTEAYKQYLKKNINLNNGAFICQYMQSCGGQIVPPQNFYKEIYEVLRENKIVCIGDQVQTGFGRLGQAFWAFEYYGVVPDILTIGKAMGNGFPVAAVVCTKQIAQSYKKMDMQFFSTFGGNPMAVTAVNSVLQVIQWQKLQQNACETGKYLKKRLTQEILPKYDFVGDIRGIGLFQGIDIVKSKASRQQDGDRAKKIITKMRQKLVLVSRDGPKHNVLKIKPPIVFNKENVDTLIQKLKETFQQMAMNQ